MYIDAILPCGGVIICESCQVENGSFSLRYDRPDDGINKIKRGSKKAVPYGRGDGDNNLVSIIQSKVILVTSHPQIANS